MSRIIREKTKNYSIIGNHALRNTELSARAKGVYAYMMTLPDDWELYKSELCTHFTEGRDAIKKALSELEKSGYLVMEQVREGGRFGTHDFHLYESPVTEKPSTVKPVTVKPSTENPQLLITDTNQLLNKPITDKREKSNKKDFEFSLFWKAYPKKENKKKAASLFRNCKDLPPIDKHIEILEAWKKTKRWKEGYIPLPSTWINGERWEDDLPVEMFDYTSLTDEDKKIYMAHLRDFPREPETMAEFREWTE